MFDINQVYKIDNFLNEEESKGFDHFCTHYTWEMEGYSHNINSRIFWKKDFWGDKLGYCEPIETTFRQKLEILFDIKLETISLYLNGQAHGQCGELHSDLLEDSDPTQDYITVVYYVNKQWSPEYGGFTVIIDNNENMHIAYPKPNSVVIFNSGFAHVGLEPTIHCKDQRVTLAHKLKVIK